VSEPICSQVVSFFRNLFSGSSSAPAAAVTAAPEAAPVPAGLVLPPAKPGETGVSVYLRALAEAEEAAGKSGVQRYLDSLG
jgi:hypothetical protein